MQRESGGSPEPLRGRHSKVYLFGKYAVKVFDAKFAYNFFKEAKFLTLLQPFGFVPELYAIDPWGLKIVMQRLSGSSIRDTFSAGVVSECLEICYILDAIGVQKEEMTHPEKHIIVADRVYFIDFERSVLSERPANVTQFCSYLRRFGVEIDVELLRAYKRSYSREAFEKIRRAAIEQIRG